MAKLETKTPVDLLHYEPPGLIGATRRQLICLAAAIVINAALYVLLLLVFQVSSNFLLGLVFIVITAPCVAAGWMRPYGLNLEVFLSILLQFYKTPPHRSVVNERVTNNAVPLRKGEYEYPDCYRPCSRRKLRQQRRVIYLETRCCLKEIKAQNRAWRKRCKAEERANRCRQKKQKVQQ